MDIIGHIINGFIALGTVGTLIFAIYELRLMRKDKEENERARLSFSIVPRYDAIFLKVTNIGKSIAHHLTLKLSGKTLESCPNQYIKSYVEHLNKRRLTIEIGKSVYIPIGLRFWGESDTNSFIGDYSDYVRAANDGDDDWLLENLDNDIIINGSYMSGAKTYYIDQETIRISEFYDQNTVLFNDDVTLELQYLRSAIKELTQEIKYKK